MTLSEAIEKARKENLDWCETVYATSDGHFFLNSTPGNILKHAGENGLEIFTIKGSELKLENTNLKEEKSTSKHGSK